MGRSYGGRKGHTFNCEPLSYKSWESAPKSDKLTFIISGHFNKVRSGKPKEEEESEKNIKPKPGAEKKLKEKTEEGGREEERRKGSMITGSEKISSRKKMAPGEAATATSTPRREEHKRNQEIEKVKESNISKQAMEAR